ncbi:hypothetical protein [Yinghuangia sp. YIM S10712]|uniref:hypothetical protein n=1 Tax=Yinghuangia sp. YIM S10712 TaxID=3436930 RepID=UPI003F5329C4
MSLSTHRTNTANPRRTQLDTAPVRPRELDEAETAKSLETGPTANPRRTNVMERQD